MNAEEEVSPNTEGAEESSQAYEEMSVVELRKLLARRGVDMSLAVEKDDLVRLAAANEDFDAEARIIFERVNLEPGFRTRYSNVDPIWQSPESGSRVYVGNLETARSMEMLQLYGISAVVNCQGLDSENFFEGDPAIDYYRFPIAAWAGARHQLETHEGVIAFFQPLWDWIADKLQEKRSVLIHCLAGAHRAGTTGTAFLMYKENLGLHDALNTAKTLRPIINPFGRLTTLLEMYGKALASTRTQPPGSVDEVENGDEV